MVTIKKTLNCAFLSLCGLASADTCPAGVIYLEQTNVEIFPISISTDISANTVLNINGAAAITINNAPTALVTVVNGTRTTTTTITSTIESTLTGTQSDSIVTVTSSTVTSTTSTTTSSTDTAGTDTSTQTSTTTSPTTTVSTIAEAVLFSVSQSNSATKRDTKRDTTGKFLQSSGDNVDTCLAADSYHLTGGSISNSDLTKFFSTSSGIPYALFEPSATMGSIDDGFTSQNGMLVWQNKAFDNGVARLCMVSSNSAIYAVFTGAGPADCEDITVSVNPISTCPGYVQPNDATAASPSQSIAGNPAISISSSSSVFTPNSAITSSPYFNASSSASPTSALLSTSSINSTDSINNSTSSIDKLTPSIYSTSSNHPSSSINNSTSSINSTYSIHSSTSSTNNSLIPSTANITSHTTTTTVSIDWSGQISELNSYIAREDLTAFCASYLGYMPVTTVTYTRDWPVAFSTVYPSPATIESIEAETLTVTTTATTTIPTTVSTTTTAVAKRFIFSVYDGVLDNLSSFNRVALSAACSMNVISPTDGPTTTSTHSLTDIEYVTSYTTVQPVFLTTTATTTTTVAVEATTTSTTLAVVTTEAYP